MNSHEQNVTVWLPSFRKTWKWFSLLLPNHYSGNDWLSFQSPNQSCSQRGLPSWKDQDEAIMACWVLILKSLGRLFGLCVDCENLPSPSQRLLLYYCQGRGNSPEGHTSVSLFWVIMTCSSLSLYSFVKLVFQHSSSSSSRCSSMKRMRERERGEASGHSSLFSWRRQWQWEEGWKEEGWEW